MSPVIGSGNRADRYICSRRHVYHDCSMASIRREDVDGPLLDYFHESLLDVEATVATVTDAAEARIGEVRTHAASAAREAQVAEERVGRIRRDYIEGRITADEWRDLQAEVEDERTAAHAEAARLESQLDSITRKLGRINAESEVARRLHEMRQAVVGRVTEAEADGLEAARAALTASFECVHLATDLDGNPHLLPVLRHVETIPATADDLPDGIEGDVELGAADRDAYALRAAVRRPLEIGATNSTDRSFGW
jgi:hypothetical protein